MIDSSLRTWSTRVLVTAVVCALCGWLALQLVVRPDVVTAVWPSAGIGLALLLLWGDRIWPGVFLGAALLDLWVSGGPERSLGTGDAMLLAGMLGSGASLQALVGARLVRGLQGYPIALLRPREVGLFLGLAGPVACLLSASVGVAALYAHDQLAREDLGFSWFSWWAGDTIGVLIFAPLVLAWSGGTHPVWRRRALPLSVIFGVMFAAAVSLFLQVVEWEQERVEQQFRSRTQQLASLLENSFTAKEDMLLSLAQYCQSKEDLSDEDFRAYVETIRARHAGMQAVEWCERVLDEDREAFEERMRSVGGHAFRVTSKRSDDSYIPAPRTGETYPVTYVVPYEPNAAAHGLDMSYEPTRQDALWRARDHDAATATRAIALAQGSDDPDGMLMFAPVYVKGEPHETLEQRRRNVRGLVLAAFFVGDAVAAALPLDERAPLMLSVHEGGADPSVRPAAVWDPNGLADAAALLGPHAMTQRESIQVADRTWDLHFAAAPLAPAHTWDAWVVLAGTLLFTSLFGAFVLVLTGRTEQIAQEVRVRTAELEALNAALRDEVRERRSVEARLRAANTQLEEARRVAEAASAAKSEFLANMSHELRTPLNAILGYSELLSDEAREAGRRSDVEDLRKIEAAGRHLLGLITDLLDLAKIESGRLDVHPSWFPVRALLDEVAVVVRPIARRRRNELRLDVGADLHELRTDRVKLRQILINLAGNAAKFSEDGHVDIAVRRASPDVASGVVFTVRDDGVGIAADQLDAIFEAFHQAQPAASRHGGTGLGLAITRRFCVLLGATVDVDSQVGVGSVFTVRLPAELRVGQAT